MGPLACAERVPLFFGLVQDKAGALQEPAAAQNMSVLPAQKSLWRRYRDSVRIASRLLSSIQQPARASGGHAGDASRWARLSDGHAPRMGVRLSMDIPFDYIVMLHFSFRSMS